MRLAPRLLLPIVALACPALAAAQQLYRCGNTFSQAPCGADAKQIDVKTSDPCTEQANYYSTACVQRRLDSLGSKASSVLAPDPERDKRNKATVARLNAKVPDEAQVADNKKTCEARIRALLKDPESARVADIKRIGGFVLPWGGTDTPGYLYSTEVNAKNGYGGYVGTRDYFCVFGTDEKTVVHVNGS